MKITLHVPAATIACMMVSAIESGDPVTTSAKGGWCDGVNLLKGGAKKPRHSAEPWYSDAATFEMPFSIEIVEIDFETEPPTEKKHKINNKKMADGLAVMASKYGRQFAQITGDNTDAPCADLFLQCILFGEEKYS